MTTEKVKNDYERLGEDYFDYYNKAYKTWLDNVTKLSGLPPDMTGTPFKMDVDSWARPYRDYMQEWGRLTGNYYNMMANTLMPPFSPSRTFSDQTSRWANSYVRIYDSWFRSIPDVFREALDINRKVSAGEDVDVDRFVDSLRNSYNKFSDTLADIYKDTPFAGITEINKSISQSWDSFPEQKKMVKDFVQESINVNAKLRDLSELTLKKTAEITSNLEKGALSENGYDKIVKDFRETLHRTYENLRFPTTLQPESRELNEDTTNWVKASIELYVSWLELNLRLTQGISGSFGETARSSARVSGERRSASPDELVERLTDTYQKSLDSLFKSSRFYETTPRWIQTYTNWLVSANKLYQTLTTPPYATKEDLYAIWKDVEKVKKTTETRAAATAAKSKVMQQRSGNNARRGSKPSTTTKKSR